MKKISETLYIDEEKRLAVVQPAGKEIWAVLNEKSALIFGPDNFANCERYVKEYENS